jgi:hypothetical protein
VTKKAVFLIGLWFALLGLGYLTYSHLLPILPVKKTQIDQNIIKIKEEIQPKATVIQTTGLPDKHLINTAFVPQAPEQNWDQPWQDACEEAAILTVHYYYQNFTPSIEQMVTDLNQIFDYQTNQGWGHDVNSGQIAQTATDLYGYQSEIIDNPSLEQLKQYVVQNIPIIVPASGKILYAENKNFRSQGPYYHALVILGYNDNTQKFTVHDVGTRLGANFKYSYPLLIESIHDLPPSGIKSEILEGAKRVVVLIK